MTGASMIQHSYINMTEKVDNELRITACALINRKEGEDGNPAGCRSKKVECSYVEMGAQPGIILQ